jgi:hypothetical protein
MRRRWACGSAVAHPQVALAGVLERSRHALSSVRARTLHSFPSMDRSLRSRRCPSRRGSKRHPVQAGWLSTCGLSCGKKRMLLKSGNGPAARPHRGVRRRGLHPHRVLLPALPDDPAAAYELASQNLDGPQPRTTISAAAVRRMRRTAALRQTVASGRYARQAGRAARLTKGLGPASAFPPRPSRGAVRTTPQRGLARGRQRYWTQTGAAATCPAWLPGLPLPHSSCEPWGRAGSPEAGWAASRLRGWIPPRPAVSLQCSTQCHLSKMRTAARAQNHRESIEKTSGGPGRARTSNQTVMSRRL